MPPLVLVTGPSGFIGAHIFSQLLEKGYFVRGTVRSQHKAEYFTTNYPEAAKSGQISFVVVEDIAQPGAFKNAIKGVDYVIHVASPFHFKVTDYVKDFYEPAIHGTTEILKAASGEKSVKRVVITSSVGAMINLEKGPWPGHVYSESDWNPITWEEAQTTKQHLAAYRASKKFAEKAAWEFIDKEKPDFDIITIQPPLVFGPCKHDVSLDSLNESNAQIWRIVSGGKNAIVPATGMWEWVDVRDAAAAHVAAIAPEVKGNQRFLLGAGEFTWQKIVEIAKAKFPEEDIPLGDPNYKLPEERWTFDVSRAEKELNLVWIDLETSVTDLLAQMYKLRG